MSFESDFRAGKSILSNAEIHVGKRFVANIDISNFFGSIKQQEIYTFLQTHGFKHREAKLLSSLVCKSGALPQGAPTSPVLTNAYLHRFDEDMTLLALSKDISYSRYADDMTFSGNDKQPIKDIIESAHLLLLQNYGLNLNKTKTRIASAHSQQRVTGLVVNEKAAPPRELRRRIRAEFHNATKDPKISKAKIAHLRGVLAFLNMFPALAQSSTVERCKKQIEEIANNQT